jgi:hypothetical protein
VRYQYCVLEVSDTNWQEIMDSDNDCESNQHLNHWGDQGWEIAAVVPRLIKGTTVGYAVVFKKELPETDSGKSSESCPKIK